MNLRKKMKTFKTPAPSKSHEAELAKAIKYMVEQISERYNNQVLKELNKSTIEKFEDAQTGNYAAIVSTLYARTKAA